MPRIQSIESLEMPAKKTIANMKLAHSLRAKGYSYARIGKELGIQETTAMRWINPEYNQRCRELVANNQKQRYKTDASFRVKRKLKGSRYRARLKGHTPCVNTLTQSKDSCEICKKETTLVLDHCHNTGKFRGWICSNCNLGLGLFKDNAQSLLNAIHYLRKSHA